MDRPDGGRVGVLGADSGRSAVRVARTPAAHVAGAPPPARRRRTLDAHPLSRPRHRAPLRSGPISWRWSRRSCVAQAVGVPPAPLSSPSRRAVGVACSATSGPTSSAHPAEHRAVGEVRRPAALGGQARRDPAEHLRVAVVGARPRPPPAGDAAVPSPGTPRRTVRRGVVPPPLGVPGARRLERGAGDVRAPRGPGLPARCRGGIGVAAGPGRPGRGGLHRVPVGTLGVRPTPERVASSDRGAPGEGSPRRGPCPGCGRRHPAARRRSAGRSGRSATTATGLLHGSCPQHPQALSRDPGHSSPIRPHQRAPRSSVTRQPGHAPCRFPPRSVSPRAGWARRRPRRR